MISLAIMERFGIVSSNEMNRITGRPARSRVGIIYSEDPTKENYFFIVSESHYVDEFVPTSVHGEVILYEGRCNIGHDVSLSHSSANRKMMNHIIRVKNDRADSFDKVNIWRRIQPSPSTWQYLGIYEIRDYKFIIKQNDPDHINIQFLCVPLSME